MSVRQFDTSVRFRAEGGGLMERFLGGVDSRNGGVFFWRGRQKRGGGASERSKKGDGQSGRSNEKDGLSGRSNEKGGPSGRSNQSVE